MQRPSPNGRRLRRLDAGIVPRPAAKPSVDHRETTIGTKQVIINADDFGATARVNAAVLRSHREGVLTAASLMVNEPGSLEAIEIARRTPTLAVGLHVAMSDGAAALGHSDAPHIVNIDGSFTSDPVRAAIRYHLSEPARRELVREIHAQFERFASTGLPLSHVDGHQHMHVHPAAWSTVVRLAAQAGAGGIRVPLEEYRPWSRGRRLARRFELLWLASMRRMMQPDSSTLGLVRADRVYGQLETGQMRAPYVVDLLGRLAGDVNEVYLHPGTLHARQLPGRTDGMDCDLEALLCPAVRGAVATHGLRLTSYLGLANERRGMEA